MVKFIESELVLLKKEIDEMWTLVYNQLDRAGEAVLTFDRELAQQVLVRERRVNALELKIDSDVEDIIALYNPVAIDLRFVLAMLKINTNLERLGDFAEGIARFVLNCKEPVLDPDLLKQLRLEEMQAQVLAMLELAKKALQEESQDLATSVFAKDNLLDEINAEATTILAGFIAVLPVASCVITAFKTPEEYASTNVMTLPGKFYFKNFTEAFQKANMGVAFLNSLIILVVVLFFSIMFGAMLAYILNRFTFPGRGIIKNLFLFASLLPGIAMQVTVYKIMYNMHLINSIPGYIILLCGTDIISVTIFIQFFENLPNSLDESAIMDGCTYFGVFFKILLPLLKPAIVTVMILKGVGTYNEYYMANLYLQDKSRLVTVATSLYKFTGPLGNQYNYICAGVIITLLPALIIFILCQKQIYGGLAAGSVKG